jgi:hypothetical protein
VFFLVLQLRISYGFYRLVAPLQVLSFPWRMLGLITPIGIILVVEIADLLRQRFPIRFLWEGMAGAWLVSLIVLSPIDSNVGYNYGPFAVPGNFPSINVFTAPGHVDYGSFKGYFLGFSFGELYPGFLPKVESAHGVELGDDDSLYRRLHRHDAGAQSLGRSACAVSGPRHAEFETLDLTFRVSCTGATRLALPISYNPYSTVFVKTDGKKLREIRYVHLSTDPRIVITVTSSKPETVVVHLPTLWGILS